MLVCQAKTAWAPGETFHLEISQVTTGKSLDLR